MPSKSPIATPRERDIFRVTVWCAFGNAVLSGVKLVVGIFGNSAAMVADAAHSLSDFATDVVLVFFMRIASRPPDADHEFGHGKYETLATVIIGGALFFVGAGLLLSGTNDIFQIFRHDNRPPRPSWIALAVAAATIFVKEAMFRWTLKIGRRHDSGATIANAWSHRADAISTIATMTGVGMAVAFGERWVFMDPLAAVVVSAVIIHAAIHIVAPALGDLVEKSLPDDVRQEILALVSANPLVKSPHNLRTRRVGAGWVAQVHVRVDDAMSVRDSHKLTQEIEGRIRDRFGAWAHIIIHVEPASHHFDDAKKSSAAATFSSAGFTLVEVLIALLLASMLIPPALAIFSSSLSASTRAEMRCETRLAATAALQTIASEFRRGENQWDLRVFPGTHTAVVRMLSDDNIATVAVELPDGTRETATSVLFSPVR